MLKAVLVTGEIVGWGGGVSPGRFYGGIEQGFEGRGESEAMGYWVQSNRQK